jgi:hypothetical protein
MTRQYSATVRDGWANFLATTLGSSPKLKIRTGTQPAGTAAADSGTLLWTGTATGTAFATASGGSGTISLIVSFTGEIGAGGTAGHYRLTTSGDAVHEQGNISRAFALTTSAATTGSNVLTFANASTVSDGMQVYAAGVPTGAVVVSHTSTTVSLDRAATVSSGVEVHFGDTTGDLWLPNTVLAPGVTLEVDLLVRTMPGA